MWRAPRPLTHRSHNMPVYEYECNGCGVCYEEYMSMDQAAKPTICPACGALGERVISTVHLHGMPTPKFHTPPRSEDPVFEKEWDEIWEDDPLVNPPGDDDE